MAGLTAHFRTEEFDCHNGAPVPRHAYLDLEMLARRYLEPLRRIYGAVHVISGYRTHAYNKRVGGAPNSMHVYRATREGAAADIYCARGTVDEWFDFLDARGAPGLGRYTGHVHIDNRQGHARW